MGRKGRNASYFAARQATVYIGGLSHQPARCFPVWNLRRRDERRTAYWNAKGVDARAEEAFVSGSGQPSGSQGEKRAGLCQIDRRKAGISFPARLCTRAEPRRIGLELRQTNRDSEIAARAGGIAARSHRGGFAGGPNEFCPVP